MNKTIWIIIDPYDNPVWRTIADDCDSAILKLFDGDFEKRIRMWNEYAGAGYKVERCDITINKYF